MHLDGPCFGGATRTCSWPRRRRSERGENQQHADHRMTVSYDPDQSMLWTLFNWHGTMVPLVLQRPVFWLLMIFHGALLPFAHLTYLNPDCTEATGVTAECSVLPLLEWNAAATLTTLLTFFMVPTQRLQLWTCPMVAEEAPVEGPLPVFCCAHSSCIRALAWHRHSIRATAMAASRCSSAIASASAAP